MRESKLYTIGEVGEICKLSKKTLRYYDKMNILLPDKVSDGSGYRYYSKENLLSVPVIKYFKQSGFKLEEMKRLIDGADYRDFEKHFRDKIDELRDLDTEINLKLKSIKDWYNLIMEAQMVIENNISDVSIKYLDQNKMIYLDQDFKYDYMESIINIEFTNYIESKKNAITGPVIIEFPSFEDKIMGKCNKMRIMQECIIKCKEEETVDFGGCFLASCYHIGPYETINETYDKIKEWIKLKGYIAESNSYERYVSDYWSIRNPNKFVTEVLIKVKKGK